MQRGDCSTGGANGNFWSGCGCKRAGMTDRRVIPLGEWVKMWYGSRVALWLDIFTLGCLLDIELEQTGMSM